MPDTPAEFPNNCIRGIVQLKHIIQETGGVSFEIFMPDNRTAQNREDRGEEVSINWEDDENVLEFTLNSRDERAQYCFPNGVIRLLREVIDGINKQQTMDNPLSYERSITENNLYHGNIVFREGLSDRVKKMIAQTLACHVSKVITRDDIRGR